MAPLTPESIRRTTMESWDLPVRAFFIPYVDWCEIRGEDPNPEFLGMTVQVFDGEARLMGDETN